MGYYRCRGKECDIVSSMSTGNGYLFGVRIDTCEATTMDAHNHTYRGPR